MCETDAMASRDDTVLLLRGALVAFNRAVRDNVFAVRVCVIVIVLLRYNMISLLCTDKLMDSQLNL